MAALTIERALRRRGRRRREGDWAGSTWSSISLMGFGVRCDPDVSGTMASTNASTVTGPTAAPMVGKKGPAPECPITATGEARSPAASMLTSRRAKKADPAHAVGWAFGLGLGNRVQPRGDSRRWHNAPMAVSRAERRSERTPRVVAVFGPERAPFALDLLELAELAWHDCYGEITPPEDVIGDMLLLSEGSIERLIQAARLAVADWRDLKVASEELRNRGEPE